ncbi:hypothetical protein FISHEDRAFT_59648 [Fistulina hepatica ATCC 64428]|uniref:Uncharacterized protein n=1 Tax=Fistulina hepatica ATCC 64428 TaxID=1128425 RepID=A0A0D7A9L8_9AGAR|nr:hypothetical protein FISHEDRAFT_59648 [Fistulina hepatica ATCC 64428]
MSKAYAFRASDGSLPAFKLHTIRGTSWIGFNHWMTQLLEEFDEDWANDAWKYLSNRRVELHGLLPFLLAHDERIYPCPMERDSMALGFAPVYVSSAPNLPNMHKIPWYIETDVMTPPADFPSSTTLHPDGSVSIVFSVILFWKNDISFLRDVCRALKDYYPKTLTHLPIPPMRFEYEDLERTYSSTTDIETIVANVKLYACGLAGWLRWSQAVEPGCLNTSSLPHELLKRVESFMKEIDVYLCRGFLVRLPEDWFAMNIPFWIRSKVGFIYPWTEKEKENPCFLRLDPLFLEACDKNDTYYDQNMYIDRLDSYSPFLEQLPADSDRFVAADQFSTDLPIYWYFQDFEFWRPRRIVNTLESQIFQENYVVLDAIAEVLQSTGLFRNSLYASRFMRYRALSPTLRQASKSRVGTISAILAEDVGRSSIEHDLLVVREVLRRDCGPEYRDRYWNIYGDRITLDNIFEIDCRKSAEIKAMANTMQIDTPLDYESVKPTRNPDNQPDSPGLSLIARIAQDVEVEDLRMSLSNELIGSRDQNIQFVVQSIAKETRESEGRITPSWSSANLENATLWCPDPHSENLLRIISAISKKEESLAYVLTVGMKLGLRFQLAYDSTALIRIEEEWRLDRADQEEGRHHPDAEEPELPNTAARNWLATWIARLEGMFLREEASIAVTSGGPISWIARNLARGRSLTKEWFQGPTSRIALSQGGIYQKTFPNGPRVRHNWLKEVEEDIWLGRLRSEGGNMGSEIVCSVFPFNELFDCANMPTALWTPAHDKFMETRWEQIQKTMQGQKISGFRTLVSAGSWVTMLRRFKHSIESNKQGVLLRSVKFFTSSQIEELTSPFIEKNKLKRWHGRKIRELAEDIGRI